MTTHPLALRLAEAESALSAAEHEHRVVMGKAHDIGTKLAEAETRQKGLSEKRVAGTAGDQDTAELAALASDIAVLREMLTVAQDSARSLEPSKQRRIAESLREQWARHSADAKLAVLVAKAREIDSLMLHVIADIREAGTAAGKNHLAESWTPSPALYTYVNNEFARSHIFG